MKDFFDTWKFKILVAVAVFLVGIMAYAGANGRLTAAPQELLGVVLMPLQKVTSALSGGIGSVWEKYTWASSMKRTPSLPTRRWPAFRIPTPKQAIFLPL